MSKDLTQVEHILNHFYSDRAISRLEALYLYKIQNITAVIKKVRRLIPVETDIKTDTTGARYASYRAHKWDIDKLTLDGRTYFDVENRVRLS